MRNGKCSAVPECRNQVEGGGMWGVVRKCGKTKEREAQGMRLLPVLWHEMKVKNTSPKFTGLLNTWRILYRLIYICFCTEKSLSYVAGPGK